MHRTFFLTSALLLAACGGDDKTSDGASDGSTGAASTSGASTSGASSGSTGSDATGTASATSPTTGEGTTTSGTEGGTGSSSGGGSSGATTGGAMFCEGWEGATPPGYLELYNKAMAPLTDGATLPIECGGQGIFMFGLYPKFGGFTPASQNVDFGLVVDVEGFNNNPEGHFYSADPIGYYVGCDGVIGGLAGVLPVFPFDEIANLLLLDGKPATIHAVMHTPDGDVTVDTNVVLSVVKDDSWALCGG